MEKGSIDFEDKNLVTVSSLKEALATINDEQVYIAGGYRLFKEALPLVDIMYITEIDMIIEDGDVFFPEFDPREFDVVVGETNGEDVKYTRTIYKRKK